MGNIFLNVSHSQKHLNIESHPFSGTQGLNAKILRLCHQLFTQRVGYKGWTTEELRLWNDQYKSLLSQQQLISHFWWKWQTGKSLIKGKTPVYVQIMHWLVSERAPSKVSHPSWHELHTSSEWEITGLPHTNSTHRTWTRHHRHAQNSCQRERTHIYQKQRLAPPLSVGQRSHRLHCNSHVFRCNSMDLFSMEDLRKDDLERSMSAWKNLPATSQEST